MSIEKARKQQFANEHFAREHREGFSLHQPGTETLELLRTGKVVELPTSEGRWYVHPINHPPVHPSQPSICGYWNGVVHEPNFKHRTPSESAHWENVLGKLGMPSALYWPMGQATQLSVLLDKENKSSTVDGVDDDDDLWQSHNSVVESLEDDGSESVEEDETPIEDQQNDGDSADEDEREIDNSETPEDNSYQLATSVHLRLVKWWKSRHENEEPLNLRLFKHGLRQDGGYSRAAPGGSRLDFSYKGRQVQAGGNWYPIGDYQPLHNDGTGRWCICADCVLHRTWDARQSYGPHDAGRVQHHVNRWTLMRSGDEFRFVNQAYMLAKAFPQMCWIGLGPNRRQGTLGEKMWCEGGLQPIAAQPTSPDVVHDKYIFNRVTPYVGQQVIKEQPEWIRQGDVDVLAKWPETLIFAFQHQRGLNSSLDAKQLPTGVCRTMGQPTISGGSFGVWEEQYKPFWR